MEKKEMYYTDEKGETYVAPLSFEKMDRIYTELRRTNIMNTVIIILLLMGVIFAILIYTSGMLTQILRVLI